MLVRLPRQCSGREIVEAFKIASTFEENPCKKWEPEEFVGEIVYVSGSVKQMIRDMGVRVQSFSFVKKWGLCGKKVWKLNHSPMFTLDPLDLFFHPYYKEIKVTIKYNIFGDESICTNPSDSRFENFRPQFERIIGNFYDELEKNRG